MLLPILNYVTGDEKCILGYVGSEVGDHFRVFFSLDYLGQLWWSVFMGSSIIADNKIPVEYV